MSKIQDIITLVICLILAAVLVPIAIDLIAAVVGTDWDPAVLTLFQVVLPILAIVGLVAGFIPEIRGD